MKKLLKLLILSITIVGVSESFAGNETRVGQAGSFELLVNPWTRSSGFGGFNTSLVKGVEAMNSNIAGLSFTEGSELVFAHTNWLSGSGIGINAFGFSQNIKDIGVLGISISSMDLGVFDIRTEDQPEGGIGTFSPQFINLAIGFGKTFSNAIHTGVAMRIIDESLPDVSASGVAFDAGVQYVTGEKDRFKFGISLRNVGPALSYHGVGLDFKTNTSTNNPLPSYTITAQRRPNEFELPTLLSIGVSRDYELDNINKLTALGNFTSNSFSNDQYTAGLQYAYKSVLMVRTAYTFENFTNMSYSNGDATNPYNGLSMGATVEIPINEEKGTAFGLDYAFRMTHDVGPFGSTHSIGARLTF